MIRSRSFLAIAAILVGGAVMGAPSQANAAFELTIRGTEYNAGAGGTAIATQTSATTSSVTSPLSATTTFVVGDFNLTLLSVITNTGGGTTSQSHTINIQYSGPTGAGSPVLYVEAYGRNYVSPLPGNASIVSNGSPSTSGLAANGITMTSGVINANTASLFTPIVIGTTTIAGTTLGGQSGMTTGSGSMGAASSVLAPNPAANGGVFAIANPFGFYQTFLFTGFTNTGAGSLSAGSTVSGVPAPAGLLALLTGLPALGGYSWLRRRKAVQSV